MSPAGPYPTKAMHEGLKARVQTLETLVSNLEAQVASLVALLPPVPMTHFEMSLNDPPLETAPFMPNGSTLRTTVNGGKVNIAIDVVDGAGTRTAYSNFNQGANDGTVDSTVPADNKLILRFTVNSVTEDKVTIDATTS